MHGKYSYLVDLAYSVGVQAFIYGYPLIAVERTRQLQTVTDIPTDPPLIASNVFFYKIITPEFKDVVSPNVDTLYCFAWLDLTKQPVVLHVPDTKDRYYVMELVDAYSNNFSCIGRRATGTKAGKFAIVGPDWKGVLPYDVKKVIAPTNTVWIVGRVLMKGEDDFDAAYKILKQFKLTSLDSRKSPYKIETANKMLLENKPEELCPIAFFKTMTDLMILNPTEFGAVEKQFEHIGIDLTHGFDIDKLEPPVIAGLKRAVRDAYQIIVNSIDKLNPRYNNGWIIYPDIGTYGDRFLIRAIVAYSGLGAIVNEESTFPRAFTDESGNQLNGQYNYVLHFDEDELPPVGAFWSVTMYDMDFFLVSNEINRYAIADYTPGLEFNSDGSLDIYIQEKPPENHESNWLPAPKDDFNIMLRLYQPDASILNGDYVIPGVKRV